MDPSGKSLEVKNKTETKTVKFSKLLLATGGDPRKLPVPGADLNHVHYLRYVCILITCFKNGIQLCYFMFYGNNNGASCFSLCNDSIFCNPVGEVFT